MNEEIKTNQKPRWESFDLTWALGCFGTAIGAGVLFFPIKAGAGGLIPFILMVVLAFPIAYFTHRALMAFVLSGENTGANSEDITEVVEEHFGVKGGNIITFLYFIAICPLLWMYGVAITNTVIDFSTYQLGWGTPPRGIVSLACLILLGAIILYGRDVTVKVMSYLVYPFIACLVLISLSLIPYWSADFFTEAKNADISLWGQKGILLTLISGISIMVFSFNHSPIISSMSVAYKEKYSKYGREYVEKKANKAEAVASILMCSVVLFFGLSCALTLSSSHLQEAKVQNIPVLSYLANYFTALGNQTVLTDVFQYAAPLIAIVAIFKSFFGHYLGTLEGLNGLILRVRHKKSHEVNHTYMNLISMAIIMGSTWIVAWINPSILGLIDKLGAPLIACLLCIMPVYAFYKLPSLSRYRGPAAIWVLIIGLITICFGIWGIFN